MTHSAKAGIVTFGSGVNSFDIEFVTIGSAGNAADTNGTPNPVGAVSYDYQIGKYEISRSIIEKFNASQSLQITMEDMTSFGGNGGNKPGIGVSWNEAARFVNWLNTSQGFSAAYKFTTDGVNDNIGLWSSGDTGYDASNPYRNSNAVYVLPTVDEWYKAAYYDPATDTWRQYASLDGNFPTAVLSGTSDNTAVYGHTPATGPADVDQAGGVNAFGVVGMTGNVYEIEETSYDLTNSSGSLVRGHRGGDWIGNDYSDLTSSFRSFIVPAAGANWLGFRVASLSTNAAVPEPGSFVIIGCVGLMGVTYGGRRRIGR